MRNLGGRQTCSKTTQGSQANPECDHFCRTNNRGPSTTDGMKKKGSGVEERDSSNCYQLKETQGTYQPGVICGPDWLLI